MIDIHCHLLPGIDDGAKSFEESLLLLKKAEAAGVTDIILTPHYIVGSKYNADNVRKWKLFLELKERAAKAGIAVRIYLGNEIYIDGGLPEMLSGYGKNCVAFGKNDNDDSKNQVGCGKIFELSTLNSGKYVLVEFPVGTEDKSAKMTLFSLVSAGFIPVIAHPERYIYVQENLKYFDDFLSMGCVLQGNYLSLMGKYGKRAEKTLKKLLGAGKIFCLASDIHKPTDEYRLDEAYTKLVKITKDSVKVRELLIDNPYKILASVV